LALELCSLMISKLALNTLYLTKNWSCVYLFSNFLTKAEKWDWYSFSVNAYDDTQTDNTNKAATNNKAFP